MAEALPLWWVDGVRGALVPPDDRGLLYGDGVFRTLLVLEGRADDLDGQLAQLRRDCDALGIACPPDALLREELAEAAAAIGGGCLRLSVTRGSGGRAYDPRGAGPPRRLMLSRGLPPQAPGGLRAVLRRVDALGLGDAKHCNRLGQVLAASEVPAEFDTAVLHDSDGRLLSGVQGNLFLVDDQGRLHTPETGQGVVAGRMRARVLAAARMLKLPARHQAMASNQLDCVAEAFLSNAVVGIAPLRRLADGQGGTLWSAARVPGPVTSRLMNAIDHPLHCA